MDLGSEWCINLGSPTWSIWFANDEFQNDQVATDLINDQIALDELEYPLVTNLGSNLST